MPHEAEHVEAERLLRERVEVAAEARPGHLDAGQVPDHPPLHPTRIGDGREGEAALARDLGGDALADLAVGAPVREEHGVGMGMDVDEAGRHRRSRHVDAARGLDPREVADRGDLAAGDADVGEERGRAGAVDDAASAQDGCPSKLPGDGQGRAP